MKNLAATLANLKRPSPRIQGPTQLQPVAVTGPNPGGLAAWRHVPAGVGPSPALVVVLHGCTQTPADYDAGSGWSTLADRHGFVVLYPAQQRANNPNLCFNWFVPTDTRRGGGEAASIAAMIEATIQDCRVDRSRVFITGLSAGGAMTSVMLATYPELFAAGAIMAGLPYGAASSVQEALERMRGQGLAPATAATASVLTASGHAGPWPSLSIFHGTSDHVVAPANAEALAAQWQGVRDLEDVLAEVETDGRYTCRRWSVDGRVVLEDYRIQGMGHGVPIDPAAGGVGEAGPYMLNVGLSSSELLVGRWNLKADLAQPVGRRAAAGMTPEIHKAAPGVVHTPAQDRAAPISGVQDTIERALRAAGLMR